MAYENKVSESKKILVCDDDKAVSLFLQSFLKAEGYKDVDIVLNAEEVLEKITKFRYGIIFLDIKLPGMDGIEALKRIKEFDKSITVIMITGFSEIESVTKAQQLGAYDYIVKPFDLAYLKLTVLAKML